MRAAFGLADVPRDLQAPVLALGTFDGVHLGHRQVIQQAVDRARTIGGEALVLTFDPHPMEVLRPPTVPLLLTTVDERVELLGALGVDLVLVLPFDLEFSRMPAQVWLDEILVDRLGAREVVAGSSYTFGHGREGTAERLRSWGRERGVAVHLVPPVVVDGVPVSSSRVRAALRSGQVREAARLLGRRYSLRGRVVPGRGYGRTVGVPTANLEVPPRKVLPAPGVYATIVDLGGVRYGGATNVGFRPTFGGGDLTVESHLLDFEGDLQGEVLTIEFVDHLRPERAFSDSQALVAQIRDDVVRVRELLAGIAPGIIW